VIVILTDVNVLLHAHREEAADHRRFRSWLESVIEQPEAFGVSEIVLSAFVRVATHRRVYDPPTPLESALAFCRLLREQPNAIIISPGARHWSIFTDLCHRANARGDLVADAYLAAMAIESGCEWVTTDRDFSRFPGLRWRHPF
jgi:uncharacterized protein